MSNHFSHLADTPGLPPSAGMEIGPGIPIVQAIGEAIGAASMCWVPIPEGVFDSERASEIVDVLLGYLGHRAPLVHADLKGGDTVLVLGTVVKRVDDSEGEPAVVLVRFDQPFGHQTNPNVLVQEGDVRELVAHQPPPEVRPIELGSLGATHDDQRAAMAEPQGEPTATQIIPPPPEPAAAP